MKKKPRTIQRLRSDLDAWVGRPRNRELLNDGARQSLQQYLDGQLPSPLARLSQVAIWLGQTGAHAVLNNDPSGWAAITTSLHYEAWDERILLDMLDKGTARTIQAFRAIFVILHAISAGEDDMAVYFGNRLISAIRTSETRITGLTEVPLCPFTLHLFAKWRQIPFEYPASAACPLAVYQDLLETWDNPGAFANHLLAACEYHVEQAFDDDDGDTQDFFRTLYDLFPVEILAIKRIREERGQPMPAIDHPLMQTSLAHAPAKLPVVNDELLSAVSSKVCKDFSIDSPWK